MAAVGGEPGPELSGFCWSLPRPGTEKPRCWQPGYGRRIILSLGFLLEESENDFTRFMNYLVAALKRVRSEIGETVLSFLQAPQKPSPAGGNDFTAK